MNQQRIRHAQQGGKQSAARTAPRMPQNQGGRASASAGKPQGSRKPVSPYARPTAPKNDFEQDDFFDDPFKSAENDGFDDYFGAQDPFARRESEAAQMPFEPEMPIEPQAPVPPVAPKPPVMPQPPQAPSAPQNASDAPRRRRRTPTDHNA